MENQLQIFNNAEFGQVRTIVDGDKILFCASDIAKALGYEKPNNAINTHCKNATLKQGIITDNLGRKQNANFIPEGDVYRLVVRSKLPTAEKFESWVFDEVLPSIRKTGSYAIENNNNEDLKLRRLNIMEENARARRLKAENDRAKLWLELSEKTNRERVKQISEAYTANTLAGQRVLELPKVEKMTYSAKDIGKIFGVSASKIGRIANKHHLKTKEYGDYFMDKARYANKEVQTFRYYENAIEVFRSLLGGAVA